MHPGRIAAIAATALALAVPAAHADRTPPLNTLDRTAAGPHFVLHYRDADFPSAAEAAAYATAGLADLEEAYSRLVSGGGGTPNVGLKPPIADDDGKTDVYLSPPQSSPGFQGGAVYRDTSAPYPRYVFMTPQMSRAQFRFRAAHEYVHVLQAAYGLRSGGLLTEASANWGAEQALPDVDAGDTNFTKSATGAVPWLPLDCSYQSWEGRSCGRGYWQWLFLQYLTERGYATMEKLWLRQPKVCAKKCTPALDRQVLSDVIAASSPGTTLGEVFAAYSHAIHDPTRWKTTAAGSLQRFRESFEFYDQRAPDSGPVSLPPLAHLAARHLWVYNGNGAEPTGPEDRLEITVSRAGDQTTPITPMVHPAGQEAWTDLPALPPAGGSFTVPFDPAAVTEMKVPLVNDTTTDGAAISYHVRRVAGPPTPPTNDTRAGARRLLLGREARQSNAYAGYVGDDSLPLCTTFQKWQNSRGVWFSFVAPGTGRYTFDARASDFFPNIATYAGDSLRGCGSKVRTAALRRGERVDVLIARAWTGAGGHSLRLRVTGPPGRTPPDTVAPTAPELTVLRVKRRKLAAALRNGLRVSVGCSSACDVRATARVGSKLARRAGLGKGAKVAGGRRTILEGQQGVVALRFTKKARKRLLALSNATKGAKRLKKARLKVVVVATTPGGRTQRAVRVTLRR